MTKSTLLFGYDGALGLENRELATDFTKLLLLINATVEKWRQWL